MNGICAIFVSKTNNSCKAAQASGMILFGGLSGGVSSRLAGGSFRQGFVQGIITTGLNHGMHAGIKGIASLKLNTN